MAAIDIRDEITSGVALRELREGEDWFHDDFFDFRAADLGGRRLAQGGVKRRTVFGGVDLIAAPHRLGLLALPQ